MKKDHIPFGKSVFIEHRQELIPQLEPLEQAERLLRQQLADLQREYNERAEPIIKQLTYIASLRPPEPVVMSADEFRQLMGHGRFFEFKGKLYTASKIASHITTVEKVTK